jgi:hypothetical protein
VAVHPLLHFVKAPFYLPRGAVNGQNKFEYQLVRQVRQKEVKNV